LNTKKLTLNDRNFLSYLRGLSIFVIVFGHVGGFWAYRPYSEFLHVFVPIFFFLSGAVSYFSYKKTKRVQDYLKKRFFSLLIPYYMVCVLSLAVYTYTHKQLPDLNLLNLVKWIQIRPSNDIMPFPLGQVWFLNTLFFITLVSPILFIIKDKNKYVLPFIIGFILILSGTELFFKVNTHITFFNNNLYKPIIHSSFYMFGILYFTGEIYKKLNFIILFLIFTFITSILLVNFFNLNIDYAYHINKPDIYYVCGSFTAISFTLLIKNYFIRIVQYIKIIRFSLLFLHKHTFSFFLLHTFSIFLAEKIFGLDNPSEKTVFYGLTKLFIVIFLTCLFSIPFTRLSNWSVNFIREKSIIRTEKNK
jgi:peptidoglycan/LPS O-acetylase OafA/YrhL